MLNRTTVLQLNHYSSTTVLQHHEVYDLSDLQHEVSKLNKICASLGLRMKLKTPFMGDFDLLLFFNMSRQFLAPGGLNAECVKVSVT